MREHNRDRGRLEDIRQYALNVEQILDGVTFDEFVRDIRIYYSVMKNVEVIGEAANMLTKDFKEQHTELPWRQIVKMRNVLVHGYAQVSDADLWDTAYNDIKPLRVQIEQYLTEIDWDAWKNAENTFSETDNALYNNAIQTARKMKAKDFAVADIAEITGLSIEEINKL
jgi:uncharacterized protein with HEPN domain